MTTLEKEQTRQSILFMIRLTFKSLTIGLAITYGLLYAFLTIKSAEAATLKVETVVSGTTVKLSDLFDDVPAKKDAIVGNAPSPGQSVILQSRTLARIASIYNIDWTPSSPAEQIVVRSEIKTVSSADILAAVKNSLMARGVTGNFEVSLNNVAPSISLPGSAEATAEVAQMNYTAGRDVFTAVIAAPSATNPIKTLSVSGQIEKTTKVPVLIAPISEGDIIGSTDIDWIDIPVRNMLNDTVIDADKLIGKTPIRMVEAGVPVRNRDIKFPQLVSRGDEILLQFNQGGLQLTAKGKAMQNGAEGDIIRVVNLSSSESLRGYVSGNKTVIVQ